MKISLKAGSDFSSQTLTATQNGQAFAAYGAGAAPAMGQVNLNGKSSVSAPSYTNYTYWADAAIGNDNNVGTCPRLPWAGTASSDGSVQNLTGAASSVMGSADNNMRRAQGVTMPLSGSISSVQLKVSRGASPADSIIVDICADGGGKPGTVLGTTASILGSSLTGTLAVKTFTFSSPVAVPAGKIYIVARRTVETPNGSNYYSVGYSSSGNAYAGGGLTTWTQTGDVWSGDSGTNDLYFVVIATHYSRADTQALTAGQTIGLKSGTAWSLYRAG